MPLPKLKLWLSLAIAFYAIGHLLWYLGTPLGQSPVLDGQENLILARQISEGTLPAEPFYRAMLYPALLALLPVGHSALGLIAHLANACLVYHIARRFWASASGALFSAALIGFNPVLLHFAFDPLDITLAIALFLGSLLALQSATRAPSYSRGALLPAGLAGALLALASLTRPHFFPVLLALIAAACLAPFLRKLEPKRCLCFIAAAVLPLLAYGFVQKGRSGSFEILPWQGAYNLWVSNNAQANGLYYTQTMDFHYLGEHQNPNRLESEALYQATIGEPGTIDDRARYWRSRTIEHALQNPWAWTKLELYKLYAICNNFEQYNNKTYAFHKALSPWLRYNPISWGLLLILATACGALFWRQKRPELLATLFVAAAFVGGLLLYMASARFRLPLVPLLAVVAGGCPLAVHTLRLSSRRLQRRAAIAAGVTAVVSFSTFGAIDSRATYVQDAMLIADAAARLGDDHSAIHWANQALELDPSRQAARRLRLISQYNLAASGQVPAEPSFWRGLEQDLEALTLEDQRLAFTKGVIYWNSGRADEALLTWKNDYAMHGLAASASLAALLLTDVSAPPPPLSPDLQAELATGRQALLGFALANRLPPEEKGAFLASIALPPQRYESIGLSLQRVLPLQ